jgi:hypothetical protein
LDYLEKQTGTNAVAIYIKRMKDKSASNTIVNRAAVALGRMKDLSAVRPLIDSLTTWHIVDLPQSGGNMNSTFGNGPGAGTFSFGSKPTQELREFQNSSVRDALTSLTGQDFGYDQQTWRRWLASQRRSQPTVDARRD